MEQLTLVTGYPNSNSNDLQHLPGIAEKYPVMSDTRLIPVSKFHGREILLRKGHKGKTWQGLIFYTESQV